MSGSQAGQDVARQPEPAFDPAPLILTLGLAPADQARFDRLRAAHFPPERNYIAAHLTLFHHLPPDNLAAIRATLAARAAALPPFPIAVTGLRPLGRGVAFALASATLSRLRAALAHTWFTVLTAQDRQTFRPHITVQNKVDPKVARHLLAQLAAGFAPFEVEATGLLLWRYRGGPWDAEAAFQLHGAAGQD